MKKPTNIFDKLYKLNDKYTEELHRCILRYQIQIDTLMEKHVLMMRDINNLEKRIHELEKDVDQHEKWIDQLGEPNE